MARSSTNDLKVWLCYAIVFRTKFRIFAGQRREQSIAMTGRDEHSGIEPRTEVRSGPRRRACLSQALRRRGGRRGQGSGALFDVQCDCSVGAGRGFCLSPGAEFGRTSCSSRGRGRSGTRRATVGRDLRKPRGDGESGRKARKVSGSDGQRSLGGACSGGSVAAGSAGHDASEGFERLAGNFGRGMGLHRSRGEREASSASIAFWNHTQFRGVPEWGGESS